jgi:hypothetical protein
MPEEKNTGKTGVRLDHLEEGAAAKTDMCLLHRRMIDLMKERLDKLEARLWVLWPIAAAVSAAIVMQIVMQFATKGGK